MMIAARELSGFSGGFSKPLLFRTYHPLQLQIPNLLEQPLKLSPRLHAKANQVVAGYEWLGVESVSYTHLNATCEQPLKPIEQYDWDFYQRMIAFFIKSPFLLTKRCLPHMKQQRWGRIVNITSEVFQRSTAPFSAYVAAKGGQVGWSRSMARELAPYGITVNMVAPGWIPVERHENDPQQMKDEYFATIPMNRWGVPKDVAEACLYFASDEAGFITGQTLCVNGGTTPW